MIRLLASTSAYGLSQRYEWVWPFNSSARQLDPRGLDLPDWPPLGRILEWKV